MAGLNTQTGNRGASRPPAGNKPVATPAGAGSPSLNDRARDYWQTLVYEWRKITWPERKQWKDSTIVVFVFVLVLMAALSLLDMGVGYLMNMLLGLNR